ncbi:hypothetical protein A2701_00965 [Candidatus Amesbacteria bacterium RIFCSPHIGHO2_01_FULL_47_34]|nr:MAG: hypothetical protein A2701_00965 [Candidatus Amesbacteria bacterium RIFCSPHIGHO2_01_FULL_47_34]
MESIRAQGVLASASQGGVPALFRLSQQQNILGKMAAQVLDLLESPAADVSLTEAVDQVILNNNT